MVSLPAIGTISYNGYTFGPMTETVGFRAKPIPSSSGRSVSYIQYTVTIRTIIATVVPTTTDDTIESLRKTLMAWGKPFQYEDKGFGSFSINVGGQAVKDVNWGPKCVEFSWKPVASRHAVELTWGVEVCIPECTQALYEHAIREAEFGVTYNLDKIGNTRRTFKGHLIIALNRNGRLLDDVADRYREKFVPTVPKNFRRVDQSFEVSADKSRLDITIADEELKSPNVPPPGIIEISPMRHSIGSLAGGSAMGFCKHKSTISATYTVARGFQPQIALDHFVKVVRDRAFLLLKEVKNVDPSKAKAGDILGVLPLSTNIVEVSAYEECKVDVTFDYLLSTGPTLFMSRGLWRPMPDSNWNVWSKSLGGAWGPRGHAGLALSANDDAIIDLCLGQQSTGMRSQKGTDDKPFVDRVMKKRSWPVPTSHGSWISIQTGLKLEPVDRVMRHVPLESGESRLVTPALLGKDQLERVAAMLKGSNRPVFQPTAATAPTVIFWGMSIRAGWEIPCPILKGAFGRAAVPANGPGYGFATFTAPLSGPIPINVAMWKLRYFLSDVPIEIPGGWQSNPPPQGNAQPQPDIEWPPKLDQGWFGSLVGPMPPYPPAGLKGDVF